MKHPTCTFDKFTGYCHRKKYEVLNSHENIPHWANNKNGFPAHTTTDWLEINF